MAIEKAVCPNCSGEATKIGNEITCVKCDAIFVFNKKGEAKVKQIGIAERLDQAEQDIRILKGKAEPEPESELGLGSEDDGPDAEED